MAVHKAEGIVLRSIPYKEQERIITLFTKEAGVISLIVKGLNSTRARLLNLVTPLTQGEYHYLKGRSDLYVFRDGLLLHDHQLLRKRYVTLEAAAKLLRAISDSQLPGKPAPHLYALLATFLKQLPSFKHPEPLISCFQLKLLLHEGLLPTRQIDPFFSAAEWPLVIQLVKIKSFSDLKSFEVTPNLQQKINTLFRQRTRDE